ncbi:hypothetical protein rosag_40080 [Roseisolibacter agri]|uniref:Uncharacterized protein n=1 Tax=Roseisolibacter agri TaxID=2014610 RepID=A0AA37QJ75_9BACT|nr:hypothetical protein rosag_40080 [Roseisolibacter agri]
MAGPRSRPSECCYASGARRKRGSRGRRPATIASGGGEPPRREAQRVPLRAEKRPVPEYGRVKLPSGVFTVTSPRTR